MVSLFRFFFISLWIWKPKELHIYKVIEVAFIENAARRAAMRQEYSVSKPIIFSQFDFELLAFDSKSW